MQLAIVIAILTLAVLYIGHRIYQAFRRANDPCYGCSGCQLKNLKKQGCPTKK